MLSDKDMRKLTQLTEAAEANPQAAIASLPLLDIAHELTEQMELLLAAMATSHGWVPDMENESPTDFIRRVTEEIIGASYPVESGDVAIPSEYAHMGWWLYMVAASMRVHATVCHMLHVSKGIAQSKGIDPWEAITRSGKAPREHQVREIEDALHGSLGVHGSLDSIISALQTAMRQRDEQGDDFDPRVN